MNGAGRTHWGSPTDHLRRLLDPASVAVVGASEKRRMSNVAVSHLLGAPVTLHLVHPGGGTAYGRSTVPSLSAIDGSIDAVLSLVGADRAVDVVGEAAGLGAGGVVVVAGGFAEAGDAGVALQERLIGAVGGSPLAVVGPNCTGFANVTSQVALFTGTAVEVRSGGISLVSASGFLMRSAMVAARERALGMRLAVSAGNEAVTTLADYLSFLIDDPLTRVICVIVEKLRDAPAFFELVERARAAGKPVIALKLGRTDRARDIVASHTGAITSAGWLYDLALRSAGVVVASDIDDLLDRAAMLAQMPSQMWRPVRNVAVITSSGGVAALVSDTMTAEVELPALETLRPSVREIIADANVVNPLDLTGFTLADPEAMVRTFGLYRDCPEVDALVVCWWVGDDDEERAELLLEPARRVAGSKPVILTSIEESSVGAWICDEPVPGIAFGRGVRSTTRGLAAIGEHLRLVGPRAAGVTDTPIPRPRTIESAAGPIVPFAAAMTLLGRAGLDVAPWVVLEPGEIFDPTPFAVGIDRLVVKLADVPHRTELAAVRLGVTVHGIEEARSELVQIAHQHGVPATIAVQAMVSGAGEAFIGATCGTELGDVIVAGLGGVLVELTGRVTGRMLPAHATDIDALLDEIGGGAVFRGLRGSAPWDRERFARSLAGAARFAQRSSSWLASMDLNPLICGPDQCVAVDALLIARTSPAP